MTADQSDPMSSALSARRPGVRVTALIDTLRHPTRLAPLARRVVYFWVVWSALLFIHEAGHAFVGREQGFEVRRTTVGVGPVLWRDTVGQTEAVLRLVPVVGVTVVRPAESGNTRSQTPLNWAEWSQQTATLAGGVLATLLFGMIVAAAVALRERRTGRLWKLGRFVVADAVVLTVFNFLPVPPLDGGRAVLGAIAAWQGVPISSEVLFWIQVGGLALAAVPMLVWTRWTARIDAAALRWGAPRASRRI
jgi:membrane-associated protease RseP (regulator of RpoE activity)